MTDTKKLKVKNWIWRGFRRIRDRVWAEIGPDAENLVEHVEDELVGLLITAVATGVFANIDDALEWLKDKVADLQKG